ncbi:hypothetical protein [Comamonas testosteroni]|uniref:hypothetical protein n=1 Tax=Comamonas testosteroni TaxID=285 RepID=UPI002E0D5E13|nr:hypothetical protein U0024_14780 [Comamonas testosteroni]
MRTAKRWALLSERKLHQLLEKAENLKASIRFASSNSSLLMPKSAIVGWARTRRA